jgi:hypothetical protein
MDDSRVAAVGRIAATRSKGAPMNTGSPSRCRTGLSFDALATLVAADIGCVLIWEDRESDKTVKGLLASLKRPHVARTVGKRNLIIIYKAWKLASVWSSQFTFPVDAVEPACAPAALCFRFFDGAVVFGNDCGGQCFAVLRAAAAVYGCEAVSLLRVSSTMFDRSRHLTLTGRSAPGSPSVRLVAHRGVYLMELSLNDAFKRDRCDGRMGSDSLTRYPSVSRLGADRRGRRSCG